MTEDVLKIYKKLDVDTFNDIWGDEFLKEYATALIKRTWGNNMKKFGGIKLPGGVELNGKEIYDEAEEELDKLREEVKITYQLPTDFFVG